MPDPSLDALSHIGFSSKQGKTYLTLLRLGIATAGRIASEANLSRPLVYQALNELIKRGHAVEVTGHKVKHYQVVDPFKIVQQAQANVEQMKYLLPMLSALQDKGSEKPRIELFEEPSAISSMYQILERGLHSRYLSCTDDLKRYYPTEFERWIRKNEIVRNKHSWVKYLMMEDAAGRELAKRVGENPQQKIQFLPSHIKLSMDFGIVDEMLIISNFDPLFMVVIHSKNVADSASVLFDMAWDMADSLSRIKPKKK